MVIPVPIERTTQELSGLGAIVVKGRRPLVQRDDDADQLWLAERLSTLSLGLQAARLAVIDIAKNWTSGRKLGRLYPDVSDAATFLVNHFEGPIHLDRESRQHFLVALIESGSSRRKAAKAAGVGTMTASRAARGVPNGTGAERLVRNVDGILGPRSSIPTDFELWLVGDPTGEERQAVGGAFQRLAKRVERWAARTADNV